MPRNKAYCDTTDLLIASNFPYPVGFSVQQYVNSAADEIDMRIGRLYKTPVLFETADQQEKFQPTIIFLKHLNAHLATGRIIMAIGLPGEDGQVHAYGKSLIDEVFGFLDQITENKIILEGAKANDNSPEDGSGEYTSPHAEVYHLDPKSGVEAFYNEIVWAKTPIFPYTTGHNIVRDVL